MFLFCFSFFCLFCRINLYIRFTRSAGSVWLGYRGGYFYEKRSEHQKFCSCLAQVCEIYFVSISKYECGNMVKSATIGVHTNPQGGLQIDQNDPEGTSSSSTYQYGVGRSTQEKVKEQTSFTVHQQEPNDVEVYGLFDGICGRSVAEFAAKKLDLVMPRPDDDLGLELHRNFSHMEADYEAWVEPLLKRRNELINRKQTGQSSPRIDGELQEIDTQLTCGASVTVLVSQKSKSLSVGHLGASRAVLVRFKCEKESTYSNSSTTTVEGNSLFVEALTEDHLLNRNTAETARVGIDAEVKKFIEEDCGGITRCLGAKRLKGLDGRVSGVSAEPDIRNAIPLEDVAFFFIMSRGLMDRLRACSLDQKSETTLNEEMTRRIYRELSSHRSTTAVAQSVVDAVLKLPATKGNENTLTKTSVSKVKSQAITLLLCNLGVRADRTLTYTSSQSSGVTSMQLSQHQLEATMPVTPYVDFSGYYEAVRAAARDGTLPDSVDFGDDAIA